jgi:hypothetical protein
MVHDAAFTTVPGHAWDLLSTLVDGDGSARHPHAAALARPGAGRRELSDTAHALCILHGTHPGLAEDARTRPVNQVAADWLDLVCDAFARERAMVARVVAAAGPLPSTAGQAASDAALVGQRHALHMLGHSDRLGCGLGAVAALVLDWPVFRAVLRRAAECFGIELQSPLLPDHQETAAVLALAAGTGAAERAMGFGAQQLLAQHRGFWSLLEARASARAG